MVTYNFIFFIASNGCHLFAIISNGCYLVYLTTNQQLPNKGCPAYSIDYEISRGQMGDSLLLSQNSYKLEKYFN